MNKKNLNSTSRTNWAALESKSEENIDYSDIPPLTDEFFERATLRIPAEQAHNLVQLDPDVQKWFQAQGEQYKTLINNVLRQYIEGNWNYHWSPDFDRPLDLAESQYGNLDQLAKRGGSVMNFQSLVTVFWCHAIAEVLVAFTNFGVVL